MTDCGPDWSLALDGLESLYAAADGRAASIAAYHGSRLRCRHGCSACCIDGILVLELEAENIRRHYPELLDSAAPHPEGACAFLGAGGSCRIYSHRPYVCRTQGLPLSWWGQLEDGSAAEIREICPLNAEGPPLDELPSAACWELGPFEEVLDALQARERGSSLGRVALRDLFRRG